MNSKNYVWVIEILEKGRFVPTADAGLSRDQARRLVSAVWKINWPSAAFRIKKYISSK